MVAGRGEKWDSCGFFTRLFKPLLLVFKNGWISNKSGKKKKFPQIIFYPLKIFTLKNILSNRILRYPVIFIFQVVIFYQSCKNFVEWEFRGIKFMCPNYTLGCIINCVRNVLHILTIISNHGIFINNIFIKHSER